MQPELLSVRLVWLALQRLASPEQELVQELWLGQVPQRLVLQEQAWSVECVGFVQSPG